MRLACVLLAACSFSVPFSTNSSAQAAHSGGTTTARQGQQNQDGASPKQQKKYFVDLYTVPTFCVFDRPNSLVSAVGIAGTKPAPTRAPRNGACLQGTVEVASSATAADLAKMISGDADYELDAVDSNQIAIYKIGTSAPSATARDPRLTQIEAALDSLAMPAMRYAEVVPVSGATAGQAATFINGLKVGGITADPLNGDTGTSILLHSNLVPDPDLISELKQRLYDFRWHREVFPPTQRLFYLNASATVKSLSGSGDGSDVGGSDKSVSDKSGSDKSTSGKSASGKSSSDKSSKNDSSAGGDTLTSTTTASPTVTVTVNAAEPDADAKKSSSDDSSDDSSKDGGTSNSASKGQKKASTAASDSSAKPPSIKAVNDMLVYSNDDGSDRGFLEKNRLMAVLDLPRPEVLLNMWSLQASSKDPKTTNREADAIRTAVAGNNQRLQDAIESGWQFLSSAMKYSEAFFEDGFYNYITQKFALELLGSGNSKFPQGTIENYRKQWGWCDVDTYCLGFTHAFEPLRPTFTNILLAIIAAKDPLKIQKETIQAMEGTGPDPSKATTDHCTQISNDPEINAGKLEDFREAIDTARTEIKLDQLENAEQNCDLKDRREVLEQIESRISGGLRLNCFKVQAEKSFASGSPRQTTRIGLLRAAVADFLFNYKWATQYPHDFVPYDLSQSAQELNAELNPLILAFNRDVAAFTQALQTEMESKYRTSSRGNETFLNDGMISVRGISGVESIVDTVTQSFFDTTKPPNLTDLVSSVADAEKNTPGVLKTNLSANEAAVLLGALNSVKPTQARIGRQLKLDITPHALAGASSAELDVKLTAEESGNPTLYTASKSDDDNLSRVATHDTTTKVRVESLKLFEVSSFSAMLQHPRSKFPLLPPFFEVPYFGTFLGIPLRGSRVYHRSTAVVSAVIVPTAADLAYGIDFTADRICEFAPFDRAFTLSPGMSPQVVCHRATSLEQYDDLPLRNYHKAITQCFVSQGRAAYTGNQAYLARKPIAEDKDLTVERAAITGACKDLKFSTIPPSQ